MSAFTIDVATPILIFGERDQVEGEVWLTNASGADIKITGARLRVSFPNPETAPIPIPHEAGIAAGSTKRLTIRSGMPVFTPAGTYNADITLHTSVGDQVIPASVVIASTFIVQLAPSVLTFTGVKKATTLSGAVLVVNKGNTPIDVVAIPDETMLEMVTTPRILAVSGGTVSVEPALAMTPGGTVKFTNASSTVGPGAWASVDIKLKMPAALPANRHFRVLPRIATQRFVVDLLT
jgi:hypothetical protein